MAQQHYRTLFKKALLQFITEPDPFLAMLRWVMTEMMRIEAEAKVGATKGKHTKAGASPENRYPAGNGLSSRAQGPPGRLCAVLHLGERRRSEQALIAVVQEAFVNGVSTRKIERLARAMGIENISASQVSEFNKELEDLIPDLIP